MDEAKHDSSKTGFQVERIAFFSDGVFAIAITLLVIEIKVPDLRQFSDQALLDALSHMTFKFLGFGISFTIIGHYWSVHHRIFGYIKKNTSTLFWINLIYLFAVVLMPFSSGMLGEYSNHLEMNVPYTIYVANLCLAGIANCLLWLYVSNPDKDLLTRRISSARIRLGFYRSLVLPLIFLLSLGVSYVQPIAGRLVPFVIPFVLHWGMKGLEKQANLHEAPAA